MEKHIVNLEIRELEDTTDSKKIRAKINDYQWSKMLTDKQGKRFKERVPIETWQAAINNQVKVLLNHNNYVELGQESKFLIKEDGIYLEIILRDNETGVYQAVKENRLHSCSFGFICKSDNIVNYTSYYERTITEMDLIEISLLDQTAAYNNTMIENRFIAFNQLLLFRKKLNLLSM
ncbi:hypothetical protein lbkm_1855 [Lachnospiraceae bacterium KM106-2]|nr:hypothetical protein lbkm_1855 [Lachnospiraceae bacterium KM106-2]